MAAKPRFHVAHIRFGSEHRDQLLKTSMSLVNPLPICWAHRHRARPQTAPTQAGSRCRWPRARRPKARQLSRTPAISGPMLELVVDQNHQIQPSAHPPPVPGGVTLKKIGLQPSLSFTPDNRRQKNVVGSPLVVAATVPPEIYRMEGPACHQVRVDQPA